MSAPSRAAVPVPAGAALARRVVERNAIAYRNSWTTFVSGFFEPVFYLFSLGVGIGALVGGVAVGDGRVVSYAEYVAPALLAASAMNGAIYDSTFTILWKLKYAKIYDTMLATPLRPRDVAVGEVSWALLRGAFYATAFLLVVAAAGHVRSWWALLGVPAAVLIGLAFAGAGMAAATFMRSWKDFDLVQLAILPMFLFGATFYPLSAYPSGVQWIVQLTPLYHGVALERQLLLGSPDAGALGHALYLAVLGLAGLAVAGRRLERLLLT